MITFKRISAIAGKPLTLCVGLAFMLLCICGCASESNGDEEKQEKPVMSKRTVLVYMAAENSLESNVKDDLAEMIEGAKDIPDDCRLAVYVDDRSLPCLYEIKNNGIKTELKKYAVDVNSADSEVFASVMEDAKNLCPASTYALVMWSHGEGWLPAKPATSRWIGIDNGKNNDSNDGSRMDISDMAKAISTSMGKLEYVLFDACDMQTIEVAYELKDCCRYLIGSPALIPGPGAPYHRIMKDLFLPTNHLDNIVTDYYNYYNEEEIGGSLFRYGVVLSIVDCSKLESFANVFKGFVQKYLSSENDEAKAKEGQIIKYSYAYSDDISLNALYYDMYSVVETLCDDSNRNIYEQALESLVPCYRSTEWLTASSSIITLDPSRVRGLAMYIPIYDQEDNAQSLFRNTRWHSAAGWL